MPMTNYTAIKQAYIQALLNDGAHADALNGEVSYQIIFTHAPADHEDEAYSELEIIRALFLEDVSLLEEIAAAALKIIEARQQ